jgi:uncharacterized protein YqjF (DUF2071 family)
MMSDFDHSIVESTAHRPWPLPRAPWLMTQSWHDVLFAHWRVGVSDMRRAVPAAFDLDLFDGEAWLGVVPFHMTNVGLRATPAVPWISAFPELNVRTYVRVEDRPGVYFFSLDAGRSLAVAAARAVLNLPYYTAAISVERGGDGLHYQSARQTRGTLKPKRTITECLDFSRAVSEAIASTDPHTYTTAFAKSGREHKILIDYLRNNRTNTSVCAFSPRARAGATVSMPLDWNDLGDPPDRWTLVTVPRRLDRLRADPWKQYWRSPQEISAASLAALARVR